MTRIREVFVRFANEESGVALILIAIMLPAIIGFSLLVIDWSRAGNLHNDLQKAADSFALAAAYELDGRSDAWDRAERALRDLVDNTSRFSDANDGASVTLASAGAATVDATANACRSRGDISWCFLEDLPAIDADPITSANYAATPEATYFVQVTVTPVGFTAFFPASFITGNTDDNDFNIGATAVAGNAGAEICDMTPLFMCNPFPLNDLNDVVANEQLYRKGIHLVVGGGGGVWESGNFGFLRPYEEHGYGEPELAQDLADGIFNECINVRRVYTQTGALSEKVKSAINTRFDMYNSHFPLPNNVKQSLPPPPAPNVRKGYEIPSKPNGDPGTDPCTAVAGTDPTRFKGFSRDAVHTGRIGDGKWEYDRYVETNNLDGLLGEDFAGYSDENPPSRYDLYMKEIELELQETQSVGGETGTPACYASAGGTAGDPDRRLIYAAILDCDDPAVIAELNGQSGAPTAMGFASFFLTEPAVDDIYAEIVDIDGAQGRGTMQNFVKENVQLYR